MIITHEVSRTSFVRWKVLSLMIFAGGLAYILRQSNSILAPYITEDLGISLVEFSAIFSAFGWGYAICQFPGGVFGDRIGARRAMALIALSSGVLAVLMSLAPGSELLSAGTIVAYLAVIWFLIGATQAPLFPVLNAGALSNWFPIGGWGVPNGLCSVGIGLGGAATPLLFLWLIQNFGWRQACLGTAPLFFIFAAIWWWYVRDYPSQHNAVSQVELDLINKGRIPEDDKVHKGIWKLVLKDRNTLLITISYFFSNCVFYMYATWFFSYLLLGKELDEAQAGIFTSSQWIAGAVGALAGGYAFDWGIRQWGLRWGGRLVPIAALAMCTVCMLLSQFMSQPLLIVSLLCVGYGLQQATEAPFWAAIIAVSGRHASAAAGVMNTGGTLPAAIMPPVFALIQQQFGWSAAIICTAILALAAALMWLFIRTDEPMADAGF